MVTFDREREEEIAGDVFDMLLSLSDFEMFREQMCDFKEQCLHPVSGVGIANQL